MFNVGDKVKIIDNAVMDCGKIGTIEQQLLNDKYIVYVNHGRKWLGEYQLKRIQTNEQHLEGLSTTEKAIETVKIVELIQKDFLKNGPDYEGQQIWQAYEEWLNQEYRG